jgi:hypothetical protein
LIAETREHLVEATSTSIAQGLAQEEAERRAVDGYGRVADVVAAVNQDGSALLAPSVIRWIAPLAVLMCLPTLVFVSVNLIEILAGSDGSEGVFGTAFDAWRSQINAVIVFGPLLALALIVLTSLRFHRERGMDGFAATVELRMSRWTLRAAVIVSLVAIAVLAYGISENYSTWRAFHNQNWNCTVPAHSNRQICYQGNSLP